MASSSYAAAPAVAGDTATRWDSISESSGCGEPFTRGPIASKIGTLSDSEAILGPFGTYFGRSIAEVRSKLVAWTVPHSGGTQVQVHEAMLPALKRVAAGLQAHAKEGRVYEVESAWAFTPRTIGGRYHISRHAMGLAIDINPFENPYRSDGTLISDMPDWYVDTWRDAGFCWGGDWLGTKDPMHFAWMGPQSTPESAALDPISPKTSKADFAGPVGSHKTQFGSVISRYAFSLSDANSNGTSDVVGLRSHPDGSVIDIALSSRGFGFCSIGRWFIDDTSISAANHVTFGDVDGDSGQDLIALFTESDPVIAAIATRRERFDDPTRIAIGAATDSVAFASADFNGDNHADLWEAGADGALRVWEGPSFTGLLNGSPLPDGAPLQLAAGDRDGGDRPELYALYRDGDGARIEVLTFNNGSWSSETQISLPSPAEAIPAIGAGDYDGDGRADAQVLTEDGVMTAYLGNTSTGQPSSRWFDYPDWDCDEPVLLEYSGQFMDDDTNIFEGNIEAIATTEVTRGCNPPFNDRFCPDSNVTREQMAAFLVRALGLTADNHTGFSDVPAGSTFAKDIGMLATAGITKGCNPPDNDMFCPKDPVTREQMAAFLTRALGLTADNHAGFTDVPATSTFAGDIGKLATAAITRGCNPPDNNRYCPRDPVTRGQMAAFLDRAELDK